MDITPIENPLEWQAMIDSRGIGFNMRGSARLWLTVTHLTGLKIWIDGEPEFSKMIIELEHGLGLLLRADPWGYEPDEPDFTGAWIEPRFVELDYKKSHCPMKEDEQPGRDGTRAEDEMIKAIEIMSMLLELGWDIEYKEGCDYMFGDKIGVDEWFLYDENKEVIRWEVEVCLETFMDLIHEMVLTAYESRRHPQPANPRQQSA